MNVRALNYDLLCSGIESQQCLDCKLYIVVFAAAQLVSVGVSSIVFLSIKLYIEIPIYNSFLYILNNKKGLYSSSAVNSFQCIGFLYCFIKIYSLYCTLT